MVASEGMIETDRLKLCRPRLADAPALWAFMGDPLAMRWTHPLATLRDCRRHLAGHERQRRRVGCAPWTLRAKADGRIVGWGGLYEDPFDPGWGVEVGYALAPAVWGRGLASELVASCLLLARDGLGLAEVRAFAHPDNAASRRVLEKAGFTVELFLPAMHRHLYRCGLGEAGSVADGPDGR